MTQKVKMTVVVLVALAGMTLAAGGMVDRALEPIGLGQLARANQRYLEESYDRALEGFLVLSAVKSGLAVIEGSEVGIGFSFQVGDLVQSVYDYVNIAWKTVLAGGTILLMTRLALDGVTMADHLVMALAFFFLLMLAAVRGLFPGRVEMARLLRSGAVTCAFAVVLLYLILPLAVFGASRLSERLTRPLIQESYDTFNQVSRTFTLNTVEHEISQDSGESSALQTAMGLNERYEHLKKRLRELEAYLGDQAKRLAGTTFQLIAGYLFDCIIFPLAFVAVLILFFRAMPGYLLGVERDRRLTRTLLEAAAPATRQPPGPDS